MNTHMLSHVLSHAARLSDQDLIARVKRLARQEREATATLIAHLAVLDERRLYLAEGCSSLFMYCTQVLHLSEHAAYGRIEAARAARRFPTILDRLAEGAVNLTTVCLLAPHLTAHNHAAVLDEARHKSKRQVEELVARLHPRPPVPSTIRRLPMLRHEARPAPFAGQDAQAVDAGPGECAAAGNCSTGTLPALTTADVAPEIPTPTRQVDRQRSATPSCDAGDTTGMRPIDSSVGGYPSFESGPRPTGSQALAIGEGTSQPNSVRTEFIVCQRISIASPKL